MSTGPLTILEVALNGPWGPVQQPGIPVSIRSIVSEAVACVKAGAAVVHVHPYDERTGKQNDDFDTYRAIIEGIKEKVDVIVYPSAPFIEKDSGGRFDVTRRLAEAGLLEWATVDPGSTNIVRFTDLTANMDGFVYTNGCATIRAGLEVAQQYGFRPAYACYEPGFVRLGAALHALYPRAPIPLYRLMFSEEFTFGFPPTENALAAYKSLLQSVAPNAPVMVSGLGVDITPLIPAAIGHGMHVRVGLEDQPLGSNLTNIYLVERGIKAILNAGGQPATPSQARGI